MALEALEALAALAALAPLRALAPLEALELLADKIGYDKLKKEYAEDLANATITAGRKSRR